MGTDVNTGRCTMESVVLNVTNNQSSLVAIRRLVIDGSSQRMLGRIITWQYILVYIDHHSIDLPLSPVDSIEMIDEDSHSYIELSRFRLVNRSASRSRQAFAAICC